MTDWCLIENMQTVMYGSSDNIVSWFNVPILVILNVPEEIDLTANELLQFLERESGPEHNYLCNSVAQGEFGGPHPKYALIRLGGGMPDREMKSHITEDHVSEMKVYDWLTDNHYQENGPFIVDWYDPRVKNAYEFYKRYDILPHDGWKFWEYYLADNEARKK